MQFRTLGSTGIRVSAFAFGAGPVPALMTSDNGQCQRDTLRRALDEGINWIDTAATYGNGKSEAGLGRALRDLSAIEDCARQNMGVFAIRVFAGGAIAGQPPSDHTYKTKFFPLDLYRRDQQRAKQLSDLLGPQTHLKEIAVRFVLSHAHVSSAILGFGDAAHVDDALAYLDAGPLPSEVIHRVASSNFRVVTSSTPP